MLCAKYVNLFSHSFIQLLDIFFNLVYFSFTEHYEALDQQDKPTVYDCIKNKEGKQ
jgi:hypothetical protein